MILDDAKDGRHLRVDEHGAAAVLYAAIHPVRSIFFTNMAEADLEDDKMDLVPWLFERVLAVVTASCLRSSGSRHPT